MQLCDKSQSHGKKPLITIVLSRLDKCQLSACSSRPLYNRGGVVP